MAMIRDRWYRKNRETGKSELDSLKPKTLSSYRSLLSTPVPPT